MHINIVLETPPQHLGEHQVGMSTTRYSEVHCEDPTISGLSQSGVCRGYHFGSDAVAKLLISNFHPASEHLQRRSSGQWELSSHWETQALWSNSCALYILRDCDRPGDPREWRRNPR
jgi:hypothetical protein